MSWQAATRHLARSPWPTRHLTRSTTKQGHVLCGGPAACVLRSCTQCLARARAHCHQLQQHRTCSCWPRCRSSCVHHVRLLEALCSWTMDISTLSHSCASCCKVLLAKSCHGTATTGVRTPTMQASLCVGPSSALSRPDLLNSLPDWQAILVHQLPSQPMVSASCQPAGPACCMLLRAEEKSLRMHHGNVDHSV